MEIEENLAGSIREVVHHLLTETRMEIARGSW